MLARVAVVRSANVYTDWLDLILQSFNEFGITPTYARQIHKRHFGRVHELVWSDERFAALRAWDWFVA